MARYNLSASMSDRANYDRDMLSIIEEYVHNYEGAFSEIDDDTILSLFETELSDPSVVDDPEEGEARLMSVWHDLSSRIKEEATPKPARLVSLPLSYESPLLDDNGGEPDGDGDRWLLPLDKFDTEEQLWTAIQAGAQVIDGWRVAYNAPSHQWGVRGHWTGFQNEQEAYTESLDVARQIGDWCCRQPALR